MTNKVALQIKTICIKTKNLIFSLIKHPIFSEIKRLNFVISLGDASYYYEIMINFMHLFQKLTPSLFIGFIIIFSTTTLSAMDVVGGIVRPVATRHPNMTIPRPNIMLPLQLVDTAYSTFNLNQTFRPIGLDVTSPEVPSRPLASSLVTTVSKDGKGVSDLATAFSDLKVGK